METGLRFLAKVEPEPISGCHLWSGAMNPTGYGSFGIKVSYGVFKNVLAHRFAYQLAHGTIPSGLCVDHKCRIRACVNPDHLRLVTRGQNVLENSHGLAARNAAAVRCCRGHEFSDGNTSNVLGRRICKTCKRERARRIRAKKLEFGK